MNKSKDISKLWFLLLLVVVFMAGCASNGQEVLFVPDTTSPTVSFTSPANGETAVPVNRKINVAFSEKMNPLTLTTATFTLTGPGGVPVAGAVTPVGTTATFTPTANLANSTLYTATITTGVQDPAGNAMASNFVWSFTTGAVADTILPTVSFTAPVNGETAVPVNRKINVAFSEVMDPATLTTATFTVTAPGGIPVAGTVNPVGTTATFTPAGPLAFSTSYTATITTGVKDLAGNALASNFTWIFTTGAVADTIRPTVSFTAPVNGQTAVPVNRIISAAFSEAMDPLSLTTANFTLTGPGGTPVAGTVTPVGTTATFTPASPLAYSSIYTATITVGVKDLAGNFLASNFVWSFTTGAIADTIRPTVSFTAPVNDETAVPVNRKINVAFSEAMDPLTLTTGTFTLVNTASGTAVAGTVTPVGTTAIFTPTGALANSTLYTATLTTGARDLAGNALASNFVWSFTTGAAADTTRPTVSFTSPTNGAIAVPLNRQINVAFSEAMDPLTLTTATITVTGPGLTPVTGTVTPLGTTAIFKPASNLAGNTLYTGTVTTGAKDLAGNAVATSYSWSFTTGTAPDVTAPTVISTIPLDLATNVATNSVVTATFSEAMDPLTLATTTYALKETLSGNNVPGIVTYAAGSKTVTFTPLIDLANSTSYTATVKGGIGGVADLAGNVMAVNKVWSFTTGAVADTTAPTVILVNPADFAINVALNSAINATFSEAMDPLSISTATFTVQTSGPPLGPIVTGIVTYDPLTNMATLTPSSNLAASTTYTATVTTGARDLAGNTLATNKVWTFTTGSGLAPGAVPLASAAPFATFGGTAGMTNTGTLSLLNGDIGTTATGTSSITGFHDTAGDIYTETPANIGPVNGLIYTCTNSTIGPTSAGPNAAACAIATQARLDAQTAYLALVAKPTGGASPAPGANLAGLTLLPGVYTAPGGSFMIQGGDLTLDAQGNANAVWVFQMATSLTVGGPGAAFPQSIILAGGAQAKNIFWQVGSFATINAAGGGTMEGTIISQAGASFSTAGNVNIVTLNGRALSLGASVTLVDTIVNVPAP